MAAENHLLGTLTLKNLPPLRAYIAKVTVDFEVDENGILHVRVRDDANGENKNNITIKADQNRLDEEEIERMQRDAEQFKADDEAMMFRAEARSYMEVFFNELYNNCTTNDHYKNLFGQDAADFIATKAEEDLNWLDANQFATEESMDTRLKGWPPVFAKWNYGMEPIEAPLPWRNEVTKMAEAEEEWIRKRSRGEL